MIKIKTKKRPPPLRRRGDMSTLENPSVDSYSVQRYIGVK